MTYFRHNISDADAGRQVSSDGEVFPFGENRHVDVVQGERRIHSLLRPLHIAVIKRKGRIEREMKGEMKGGRESERVRESE